MGLLTELFTKKWKTIDFIYKSLSTSVDNTKSAYYIQNGFHPYDCMTNTSVTTRECTYKIQFNEKTKKYRVKHSGDFENAKLLREAYSKLEEYKLKIQK